MPFLQKIQQLFRRIFRSSGQSQKATGRPTTASELLFSKHLNRSVRIDLYLPNAADRVWSLLLLNDGQDGPALKLEQAHKEINATTPVMIVGIHAGDRMAEYGTAGQLSDSGLGKQSGAYQDFILKELLPDLHRRYPISARPERVGIAGCSLGGLSAIDLAWSRPKVFGIAGVFSGSLWWRDQAYNQQKPDANRVMHKRVSSGAKRKQRIWLMAGTADEDSDRNQNGIIDAIDDTLQLIDLLKDKVNQPEQNICYLEVIDGEHNPATWAKVMPEFLKWAY